MSAAPCPSTFRRRSAGDGKSGAPPHHPSQGRRGALPRRAGGIEREIAAKRRELRAADEERAFPASDRFDSALSARTALASAMMTGGAPYAPRPGMVDDAVIAQQIARGNWQPRPASRPMR